MLFYSTKAYEAIKDKKAQQNHGFFTLHDAYCVHASTSA